MRTLLVLVSLVLVSVGVFLLLRTEPAAPSAASAAPGADPPAAAQSDDVALVAPAAGPTVGTEASAERRTARSSAPPGAVEEGAEDPEARVRGVVVDARGHPVSGARVWATSTGFVPPDLLEVPAWMVRVTTTTDEAGHFVVEGIAPKSLHLAIRASGFAPYDGTDLRLPDELVLDLEPIVLDFGALLSGRVVDADGIAVAGASLHASPAGFGLGFGGGAPRVPAAVTDEQGSFLVDQVAAGPWVLRVEHPAHPSKSFEGNAPEAGKLVGGLELQLPRGASIQGRVIGLPAGIRARVSAAPVTGGPWAGGRRLAELGPEGAFALGGVEEGIAYRLRLEGGANAAFFDREEYSEPVEAVGGSSGVVLEYLAPGSIHLRVVDGETGAPIERLSVSVGVRWLQPVREEGEVQGAYPGGIVRLDDLRLVDPADAMRLRIESPGYRTLEREGLRFAPGEVLDLGDVALSPVPTYRVTVLDAATRAPIADARVTATPDVEEPGEDPRARQFSFSLRAGAGGEVFESRGGQDGSSGRTDEEGVAVLNALSAPRVAFHVVAAGYARTELGGIETEEDGSAGATVLASRGGAVLVRVVDADGVPAAGRSVRHRAPDEGGGPVFFAGGGAQGERTNAKGEVLYDNLAVGRHRFKLSSGGPTGGLLGRDIFVVANVLSDEVPDEWTEVDVVEGRTSELLLTAPREGALVGTVTENGVRLVGASLSLREGGASDPAGLQGFGGGGGARARSGARGAYRFDGIEEGDYTLTVTHPTRRMPMGFPVEVQGSETRFDVDLPVSVVSGRILDSAGRPVSGVTVRAQARGGDGGTRRARAVFVTEVGGSTSVSEGPLGGEEVRSDGEGRYALRGVAPDTDLELRVEGESIQPVTSDPFRVAPGEERSDVDVEVERGGRMEVVAYQPDGTPVGAASVVATYQDEEGVEPRRSFVQEGRARIDGLRPGRWEVRLQTFGPNAPEEGAAPQTVEVTLGKPAEVRFDG